MELQTTLIVTGLFAMSLIHFLITTRLTMLDARSNLKANLDRRYDLIKDMFKIVQVHIPEYGSMLELLITMRLDRSKSMDENTNIELNQEVFQMLFELINVTGYVSENDTHIRDQFKAKLEVIEKNIKAANAHYENCLSAHNRVFFFVTEPFSVPAIHVPTEEKKKAVLKLLDSMVS